MSDSTQEFIHKFWELVDVILNSILFILIAFVLIVIDFNVIYIMVDLISVFIVLVSRVIIVYLPHFMIIKLLKLTIKEAKLLFGEDYVAAYYHWHYHYQKVKQKIYF